MEQVLIFGGFIENKGAQSMLFTVVNRIKKEYPDCNIYVVTEKNVDLKVKNTYNFNFLEIGIKSKLSIAGLPFSVISLMTKKTENDAYKNRNIKIIKNTDLFIDISGFALSSKFTRNNTISYLSHIAIAKKLKIPMYLMPQSFGPFNYNSIEKPFLLSLIKYLMTYPKCIYAREDDGYQILKDLGLKNIESSLDTVFYQSDEYESSNIYQIEKDFKSLRIKKNSIAIIPNTKTIDNNNKKEIYKLYSDVINYLIKKRKNIYLLRHSTEDLSIITSIYNNLKDKRNVILVENEYSSIELQNILSKFDYIVASRYHSIVHAYKVGTPALVLGWAVKYHELTKKFNQEKYQFDVNNINPKGFLNKLEELENSFDNEKKTILDNLKTIKKKDIFEEVLNLEREKNENSTKKT